MTDLSRDEAAESRVNVFAVGHREHGDSGFNCHEDVNVSSQWVHPSLRFPARKLDFYLSETQVAELLDSYQSFVETVFAQIIEGSVDLVKHLGQELLLDVFKVALFETNNSMSGNFII